MGLIGQVLKKINKKYRVKVQGAVRRPTKRRRQGKLKDEEGYSRALDLFPGSLYALELTLGAGIEAARLGTA